MKPCTEAQRCSREKYIFYETLLHVHYMHARALGPSLFVSPSLDLVVKVCTKE